MTTTDVERYGPAFHTEGNYRPVSEEVEAFDLPVSGSLPTELCGSFLRNGPNPVTPSLHWFYGEGMIHGLRITGGRARWYRNRWVRTASFTDGIAFRDAQGRRNLTASKANTHVVRHAGRILALVEGALPYEVTGKLDTVGPWDFDGRLTTAMTAHPKVCPTTAEMHFFAYDQRPPYLTYHVADASGRLVLSRAIDVAASTMMHDFNLSERFVVFMDLPIVFDLSAARAGNMFPFRYDVSYGARLGVLPRANPRGGLRWFAIEPCYVFHTLNAHDADGVITIDVSRLASPTLERGGHTDAQLWRWTIDLNAGTIAERQLDDRPGDFPRIDDRLAGMAARRGWPTWMPGRTDPPGESGTITVYDLVDETSVTHRFGDGRVPGEAVFAPADDRAGGNGWLLAYVYDPSRDASDVVVLDADHPEDEAVATVHLPVRVPYGFHGNWLAD
jgi:carotenoid cleavage dioxygenase